MARRGWRGKTGSIWSTVKWLEREGFLVKAGTAVSHGKKSVQWAVAQGRLNEVRTARQRNAPYRLDDDAEIVLIPDAGVGPCAAILNGPGPLLWGMRFTQGQLGLALVLDPTSSSDERDVAVQALHAAGAAPIRLHVREVLPPGRLRDYATALMQDQDRSSRSPDSGDSAAMLEGEAAQLPPSPPS